MCVGGGKGRSEYTDLRISVKMSHSVYEGSVGAVWSAWGWMRFMQGEFVSAPVRGGDCEHGLGVWGEGDRRTCELRAWLGLGGW